MDERPFSTLGPGAPEGRPGGQARKKIGSEVIKNVNEGPLSRNLLGLLGEKHGKKEEQLPKKIPPSGNKKIEGPRPLLEKWGRAKSYLHEGKRILTEKGRVFNE